MRFAIASILALALAGLAFGQTKMAESTAAPVVFVYAPGFGIVGAVLGPSITVTCTSAGVCTIAAPSAPSAPVLTAVSCEAYASTAGETVFTLKNTPNLSAPFSAIKNGLLLMNLGGLDYTLAGNTVTMTAAQAGAVGDSFCFNYSH